jgi:hypothetical protein
MGNDASIVQAPKNRPSYIFPIIMVVVLIGVFCLPLLPKLVKAVVPFPKLEETNYLEGIFDYEGEFGLTKNGTRLPKYYVVNAQGRHEYQCGYLGGRHDCFSKPSELKGLPIKVWTNYWYGRVQYEITPNAGWFKKNHLDHLSYSYEKNAALLANAQYQETRFSPIGPIGMLIFLIWLIYKERERRKELLEKQPQTLNKPSSEEK